MSEQIYNDLIPLILANGIDAVTPALSLNVTVPYVGGFRCRIDGEIMKVTDVIGFAWVVERGAEGTAPAPHSYAAVVHVIATAGGLTAFVDEHLAGAGSGPAGPPGGLLAFLADGPIGGHRAVRPTGAGKVGYASNTVLADANNVIGITTGAAVDMDTLDVLLVGEITEPAWAWVPDLPVFLGLNGLLTQVPPTAGFSLVLGVPSSPTTLVVGIKQPIVL